jgi:pimeloyl-ACP methyl ester carboxylesterase
MQFVVSCANISASDMKMISLCAAFLSAPEEAVAAVFDAPLVIMRSSPLVLLRIAVLFALVGGLLPSIVSAQTLPSVIQEQENPIPFYGTWTLDGADYNAVWNNGALAILTVQSFAPASVIINRTDTPGSVSYGMTAVYTGQISSAGNSVVNGSVTWTWPGHDGYPATGSWSASWSLAAQQITLVDPVPQLLRDGAVIPSGNPDDNNILATQGRIVTGIAADGVAELLVRISGINIGDQLTLTLLNDADQPSGSVNDDGALGLPGDKDFSKNSVPVTAVSTSQGPMGFAVYRAPIDFPRPTIDQDKGAEFRAVSIQVQPPSGAAFIAPITILRPPVVLVHGLWSSAHEAWEKSGFLSRLVNNGICTNCFSLSTVNYDYIVTLQGKQEISANALGFQFNAPRILKQLWLAIYNFKNGTNTFGIQVAAVQADVVAHSMGGDITRTLPLQSKFYSWENFGQGDVHKVITIDTPHLGTPVARSLLDPANQCVAKILNDFGQPVISLITVKGQQTTGAVYDLNGDGHGSFRSDAILAIQQEKDIYIKLPTAFIAGEESSDNLSGLDTCTLCLAWDAKNPPGDCRNAPLTKLMDQELWPSIFSDDQYHSPGDDGLVPLISQLNGAARGNDGQIFDGYIHSPGTVALGFNPPTMLNDSKGLIPLEVINILNTPITEESVFIPTAPGH